MLELLVQTKTGTSNLASTLVTFDNNTVAGNSIIVVAGNSSSTAGDISGVTDTQGNVYTKDNATANATVGEVEIWHTSGIIGGANTVTVAYTTGVACAVIIREYNGLIYSNSLDKQTGTTGNSANLNSGNTTPLVQTNELLIGAGLIPLANSFSAGTGFVNLVSTGAPLVVAVAAEDQFVTTGGAQAATFTANASIQWVCVVASFFLLPTGTTTSTSSTSSTSSSISTTSSSTSSTSTSASTTSVSTSSTSSSTSTSSTSSSTSSTSSSTSSTSISSTSSSTSISSTSSSISSTSMSSTSLSSTSSSTSISSTSTSFSSTSSSISSTSRSTSSTSFSSTSSSSSTSTTTLPPLYLTYSYEDKLNLNLPTNFPTNAVLDSFNRADTGAPPSTSWTQGMFTFAANAGLKIVSNQVLRGTVDTTFDQGDYWNVSTFGPDSEVYVRAVTPPAAAGDGIRLYVRLANVGASTTNGYMVQFGQSGVVADSFVQVLTNAVGTSLITFTANYEANDIIGFQMVGTKIYVRKNNTTVATITDSTYSAAGFIGLSLAGTTPKADDFGGGSIDNANLLNPFTIPNYSNVSGDDGDYFIEYGSEYMVREYKRQNGNNTDIPSFTWRGRSTYDTRAAPILIQIYNNSTNAWETLAVANQVPPDTDFSVTVSQTTNLSNYYNSQNIVSFRSYQQVI